MRKLLIIIILMLIAFSVNAQWVVQNSGVNVNLYDVKFANRYTGWAVGENGVVLKTTNGGTNWIFMNNPSYGMGKILSGISVVDTNIMYFVGTHYTFIKTIDGGKTWIPLRNGPLGMGNGTLGVHFINKDTGWTCGAGKSLRTMNGGISFDSSGIFFTSLNDIYFKDFDNGLICGDGTVFKTTNAGTTWFNSNIPVNSHYYMFLKLSVVNINFVSVIGNGPPFYRSSDFGNTWEVRDSLSSYPPSVMYCCAFSNENIGFAGGTYGYLYKTTDGGYNWQRQNTINDQRFWGAIYCYNDSVIWGVGGAGKIMHTTNGGEWLVGIQNTNTETLEKYSLSQNYPNPFNPTTKINFALPKQGFVSLKIYDITGREIKILVNEVKQAGYYTVDFNGSHLSSGVYFYKIQSGDFSSVKRMVLIK